MQAYRTILSPKNNEIKLLLPFHFDTTEVEIIVLPFQQTKKPISDNKSKTSVLPSKELSTLQKLLLSGPVMSDADYIFFKEKRNHLNQWK